jgi:two-component system chemotaxis response regulator CheB
MEQCSVPVVVITGLDTAKTAYEASLKGALEFYSKDLFTSSLSPGKKRDIYETLKRISGVKARKPGTVPAPRTRPFQTRDIRAAVIAASTGGPKALSRLVSLLPADFPVPLAVVQHNAPGFDTGFAQWLDTFTKLDVKLAEDGEIPRPGVVYVARTGMHLAFRLAGAAQPSFVLSYAGGEPEHNQKPAADPLFRSAADCLGASLVSVVLTGMGRDGAEGTRRVRERGGITLAQDEESSLIYGMPRAAAETGCVDMIVPLDGIPAELAALTGRR